MFSAAPAARRQRRRAPLDGSPGISDAQLHSAGWARTCADSSTRTPTPSCPADRRPRCRPGWCRSPPETAVTGSDVTTEARQPSEQLIPAGRELMIDAHVGLILIVHLVGRPAVVVRGAGVGRHRIAHRAAPAPPDPSALLGIVLFGKLLTRTAHRRRRIVDVLAERHLNVRRASARWRSPCGRCSVAGPDSPRRRTSGPWRAGRRTCRRTDSGGTPVSPGCSAGSSSCAFKRSLRKNSNTLPWKALVPDLVVRLTTPPLNRPNSAGGLLVSILNSWMASMIG